MYPRIDGQMFSIEIEADDKGGMALRILKYAVGGALRHSTLEADEEITIDLPRPCVIFLKSGMNTPKQLIWNINSFDGQKMKVVVPVLRLGDLSVREIAERNLFPVGQFFLRTLEPLTKTKLEEFSKTALALISELKDAVEQGVVPAHVGLKIQDNIRKTAENAVSRANLEGVDLEMAASVVETLTCIDYDDIFRQLEERGRSEGITQGIVQGRNALAKEMAVTAFRQEGRIQAIVVNDLKRLGISEQIINAAKDLVDKEKETERPE